MPFTPTHVLAVLPVAWVAPRRAPLSALAIGSMVPDWPLFVPFGPGYDVLHSFTGIVTACLPLGLLLFLFFQLVLKRALYELLPPGWRGRIVHLLRRPHDWWTWHQVRASVAIVVGAMSHIVWDAFTHEERWGVALYPSLHNVLATLPGVEITGYETLQYGSTAIGLPLMAVILALWLRRQPCKPVPAPLVGAPWRSLIAAALVLLPSSLGMLLAAGRAGWPLAWSTFHLFAFFSVTLAGFWFLVLLAVYGCAFTLFRPTPGQVPASG